MNLKEGLDNAAIEFNNKLQNLQNTFKTESEQLNFKFQKLEGEAKMN